MFWTAMGKYDHDCNSWVHSMALKYVTEEHIHG